MTRQETSDLFRWMLKGDRIGCGLSKRMLPEEIDEICYLIEGDNRFLIDEWREYQESIPVPGIGFDMRRQG